MQNKYINGKNFLVEQEMVPTPLKEKTTTKNFSLNMHIPLDFAIYFNNYL